MAETVQCVHCHKETPLHTEYKPPNTIFVIHFRTKFNHAVARKPIVIGDKKLAERTYAAIKNQRTKMSARPVLVEYTLPEDGFMLDDDIGEF